MILVVSQFPQPYLFVAQFNLNTSRNHRNLSDYSLIFDYRSLRGSPVVEERLPDILNPSPLRSHTRQGVFLPYLGAIIRSAE